MMPEESKLDLDMVDNIFEELDGVTSIMIEDWKGVANWIDNDELIIFLRLQHMAKRSSALDKLVPDRICPECNERESNDSRWRIDKFHSLAICCACFRSNYNFRVTNPRFIPDKDEWLLIELIKQIFHTPKVKFLVDGGKFGKVRAILGITKTKMAKALGVTTMAICKIEDGSIATMPRERIIVCMSIFRGAFTKKLKELGHKDISLEKFEYQEPKIEEIK